MKGFGSISEAAYLGIYSMIMLASSGSRLSATEIANKLYASRHHVTKVLQLLQKNNYLGSTRGPGGGFYLLLDPGKISLLEIYELVSGKLEVNDCALDRNICPFQVCIFDPKLVAIKLEFKKYLKSKTFSDYQTIKS